MALLRALRFELTRSMSPVRIAVVLLVLLGIVSASLRSLDAYRLQWASSCMQGSSISTTCVFDPTAFDIFYLAVNDQFCAGVLIPLACLVLCGDICTRDRGEFRRLIVSREGSPSRYIAAKTAAAFVLCAGCIGALFALSVSMGLVVRRMSLGTGEVPQWLAVQDARYATWGSWSQIPSDWSYPLLLAALLICFILLEFAITLVVLALGGRCKSRYAPIVVAGSVLLLAYEVPTALSSLGFAWDIDELKSVTGFVSDHLSLSGYRLGAGFFDTAAGQLATELPFGAGTVRQGELLFPINSFASLLGIWLGLLVISSAVLHRFKNSIRIEAGSGDSLLRHGASGGDRMFDMRQRSKAQHFARSKEASGNVAPREPRAKRQGDIHIRHLYVSRGGRIVLKNVAFDARGGTVVGLMGANGSGKSTLLLVLAGLLDPREGEGEICGCALRSSSRSLTGVMFENPPFDDERSGLTNLRLLAELSGMSAKDAREAARDAMAEVGLDVRSTLPVGAYSQGMRKKLGFAQTFLGSPALYLLDEPMNGLDPLSVIAMRNKIRELADGGATVVISSHLLHELEQVCDDVYMLIDGSCKKVDPSVIERGALEDAYVAMAAK